MESSSSTHGEPGHNPRGAAFGARHRPGLRDRFDIPALAARPGGRPDRFARALGSRHPVATFVAAILVGFLVLAAASVLLGLFVVHVLLGGLSLGGADESVNRTLAAHRTSLLTGLSSAGSQAGGGLVLPILVGLIAVACAVARHWRVAVFVLFALITESATYRVTTLFIHRHRPSVHRLDTLPVNASYPSGHTAASVAVYSGLVLLLTSRWTDSRARALAWTFAIVITTVVAFSRLYRGMHHPIDVAGGALVGIGAILVVLFACRAAGAAADARQRTPKRTRA